MDSKATTIFLEPAPKNSKLKKEYPFPLFRTKNGQALERNDWEVFIAHLRTDCVVVNDPVSIRHIYNMGYFGESSQSKGLPIELLEKQGLTQHADGKYLHGSTKKEKGEVKNFESLKEEKDEDVCDDNVKEEKDKDDNNENINKYENQEREERKVDGDNIELFLTFEEAFFLSHALGCLVVKEDGKPLDLETLWSKFCHLSSSQRFPSMYVAFHHFRSKGWIVKSGLKYSSDFALYKDGPPFYHSTYVVTVKELNENLQEVKNRPFSWASLAAINRVSSHSGKGVLICYVIRPDNISENESTPSCISQYKIQECLIKRWVPSESRENDH